jgi:hypothetical protein
MVFLISFSFSSLLSLFFRISRKKEEKTTKRNKVAQFHLFSGFEWSRQNPLLFPKIWIEPAWIEISIEGKLADNRLIHLFWHLSYSPRRCRCVQIGLSWEKGGLGENERKINWKKVEKMCLKKMGKSEQAGSPKFFGGNVFFRTVRAGSTRKFSGKKRFSGKICMGSDWLRVARGGCGTPPLAARPTTPLMTPTTHLGLSIRASYVRVSRDWWLGPLPRASVLRRAGPHLIPITPDRHECFQFFITSKRTNNANNATH